MTAPAAQAAVAVGGDEATGTDALDRALVLAPGAVRTGAAAAAAVLALTSTGSMLVAAVLLGVGCASRWSTAAALLAVGSVGARFSTVAFDDVAGIQSVLGVAVRIGPATGAVSAGVAASALLLAARSPDPGRVRRLVVALAAGAMAAAVAAGPGPGGDLVLRAGATVLGTGFAFATATLTASGARATSPSVGAPGTPGVVDAGRGLSARPRIDRARTVLAVLAGVASVVLAGWPS